MSTEIRLGLRPENLSETVFIHSLALAESSEIGARTRIWPFAHVMKGAKVGEDCNIGEHVYVESGAIVGNRVTVKNGISLWNKVVIEDDVFLGPHAVFTNVLKPRAFLKRDATHFALTRICRGATIGAGAVILCGIEIGEFALVAAGAVVTKSIPPHGFVAGNPAKLKGYVCKCLESKVSGTCEKCESNSF